MKPLPKVIERRDARRSKERAWQSIRKTVLLRDGYACRACHQSGDVDVHHKKLRSAGGADTTANLLALCRYCHALVHAYRLFIHGESANGKLRFELVNEARP